MSRRAFAKSVCGFAAALWAIDESTGCTSGGSFGIDRDMLVDAGKACEHLHGTEFIFDVQTHHVAPNAPWRVSNPALADWLSGFPQAGCGAVEWIDCFDARHYARGIFVESETTLACLSGVPAPTALDLLPHDERASTRELIDKLGGAGRLLIHASVFPEHGPEALDAMTETAEGLRPAAWKIFPSAGGYLMSDDLGLQMIEHARRTNVHIVCAHRGIAGDDARYDSGSSPRDLVRAARQNPDLTFIAYHSGWEPGVVEGPFDESNPRGIDRLIYALVEEGISKDGNVYAELGSTWRGVMGNPLEAAHVIGKLLRYVGEDRILWGTDCVWTGSPQEQIVAFRAFEIQEELRARHGYPALTAEAKRKIFGLNAARVYGVDPSSAVCAIDRDALAMARAEWLANDDARPMPALGPRTRSEWRDLLAHELGRTRNL